MQVSALNETTPSFGSLYKVRVEGKLKKSKDLAVNILDEVLRNRKIMEFCNSHDSSIVLYGRKALSGNSISLSVIFKDLQVKEGKISRLFRKFGNFLNDGYRIGCDSYGENLSQAQRNIINSINCPNGSLACQMNIFQGSGLHNPDNISKRKLLKMETLQKAADEAIDKKVSENFLEKFISDFKKSK